MSLKIKKTLVILIIVLALLILASAAAIVIPNLKSRSSTTDSVITIDSPVGVAFGTTDNIIEYSLDNDVWYYTEKTALPIKQSSITRILNLLPDITAIRTLEPIDDLSFYGLSSAAYTLIVTADDGSSQTLTIGNEAGELGYYAKSDTSEKILIISIDTKLISYISCTLFDTIDADAPASMGESAISEMTVSQNGKSASFKQEDDGWYYLDESGKYIPEEDFSAIGSDGESHTVRKYLNDVGSAVSSFKSQGCVGYDCTDDELSSMGFDAPLTVSIVKTDDTEITYSIGNSFTHTDDIQYYYFTTNDNPAVFRMPASAVTPFIELITALGK